MMREVDGRLVCSELFNDWVRSIGRDKVELYILRHWEKFYPGKEIPPEELQELINLVLQQMLIRWQFRI